jgi:hypothetical protein
MIESGTNILSFYTDCSDFSLKFDYSVTYSNDLYSHYSGHVWLKGVSNGTYSLDGYSFGSGHPGWG